MSLNIRLTEAISIHALLAESDSRSGRLLRRIARFQSTLSLRRATRCRPASVRLVGISIHALLAESDISDWTSTLYVPPISIHALLAESDLRSCGAHCDAKHFNPRSPCGERLGHGINQTCPNIFQSTLSLRRATPAPGFSVDRTPISIHALLAESDAGFALVALDPLRFQSTLSLRRATGVPRFPVSLGQISIHALLAESDIPLKQAWVFRPISIHALLAESDLRPGRAPMKAGISIHALLAESDQCHPQDGQSLQDFNPRSPCGERRAV